MTRLTAAFFLGTSLALSAPAMAFDISAMTDDEKAAFGEAVRDYLMENLQVLEWDLWSRGAGSVVDVLPPFAGG